MEITQYLSNLGILWFPINLEVKDGKKTLKYTHDYMPKLTDFRELSRETIIERQKFVNLFTHIAMDTSEYYHIDFDTNEFKELRENICKDAPYFLSSSKKLPHVFIKPDEKLDLMRVQTKYDGIEILSGTWSYAPVKTKVYNHEIPIQKVNIKNIIDEKYLKPKNVFQKIDGEEYQQLLEDFGFTNIRWKNHYDFSCDQMGKGSKCLLCDGEHRSNNFFVKKDEYGCVWVKNHSNKCNRHKLKSDFMFTIEEQQQIDNEDTEITDEYIIKRREFEKQVCMILNPLVYPCVEEDDTITLLNRNQLYERFTSMTIGPKKHSFIKTWLLDPMKRQYRTVDFIPENCPETTFNLWKGYDVERVISDGTGDIQPFLDLANQLTQNNTDYFFKWLAFLFQHPGAKHITSPVFTSVQGTGKNSFFDLIGKMMGQGLYYETSDADNHLFGRFATCIEKCKLIFIDEMESDTGFKHQSKLKALITNTRHTVERKGINSYEVQNLASIVFASNNPTPVKIEKTDRRFFVYNPQNNLDQTFFDKWRKWITNPQNRRAVYDYLMAIDTDNVNWIEDRPITETYVEMKYTALPSSIKWLDYLITESFPSSWVGRNVLSSTLYDNFKSFGHSNDKTPIQFGKELKRLKEKEGLRGITKADTRSSKGAQYEIDRAEVFNWLKEKGYTLATELEPAVTQDYIGDY